MQAADPGHVGHIDRLGEILIDITDHLLNPRNGASVGDLPRGAPGLKIAAAVIRVGTDMVHRQAAHPQPHLVAHDIRQPFMGTVPVPRPA